MKLHLLVLVSLVSAQPVFAQNGSSTLNVTGDAAINVVPDRVRLFVGVESRNKDLLVAKAENDAGVRKVIAAARAMNVTPGDIQTDYVHVDMSYDNDGTTIDYYKVTKDVQILLRNVEQFEEVLSKVLLAGANHIYDVEFSTSELRTHRDAARALAMKAAQEKASDLAAAAGLRIVGTPIAVSSYSYGGGASYGRSRSGGYGQSQNVSQSAGSGGDGIGADGDAVGTVRRRAERGRWGDRDRRPRTRAAFAARCDRGGDRARSRGPQGGWVRRVARGRRQPSARFAASDGSARCDRRSPR